MPKVPNEYAKKLEKNVTSKTQLLHWIFWLVRTESVLVLYIEFRRISHKFSKLLPTGWLIISPFWFVCIRSGTRRIHCHRTRRGNAEKLSLYQNMLSFLSSFWLVGKVLSLQPHNCVYWMWILGVAVEKAIKYSIFILHKVIYLADVSVQERKHGNADQNVGTSKRLIPAGFRLVIWKRFCLCRTWQLTTVMCICASIPCSSLIIWVSWPYM